MSRAFFFAPGLETDEGALLRPDAMEGAAEAALSPE